MERKLQFHYEGSCDLLDALEALSKALPEFGVRLEILDGGGGGYEEIRLTKLEPEKEE